MRYRKKAIVIDAVQWTGVNVADIRAFVADAVGNTRWDGYVRVDGHQPDGSALISIWNAPEGQWISAPHGHWIIRGVAGEFYPCEPAIFAATYEPAGAGS